MKSFSIGRKRVSLKIRRAEPITPKGFVFKGYSHKKKALVYVREKE